REMFRLFGLQTLPFVSVMKLYILTGIAKDAMRLFFMIHESIVHRMRLAYIQAHTTKKECDVNSAVDPQSSPYYLSGIKLIDLAHYFKEQSSPLF
ncbi:hypothetical protein M2T37_27685, partial [Klebsiella pneumoniae]|uniref:hypothetical protein n=1 Tax=Klebsiella pneumoniae TaxID=573 RepID=UPI00200D483A